MTRKSEFNMDFTKAEIKYGSVNKMIIAVRLPTGVIELIINTEMLRDKMEYYATAYDDTMRLKTNNEITIVDWMFTA